MNFYTKVTVCTREDQRCDLDFVSPIASVRMATFHSRRDYSLAELSESTIDPEPLSQLQAWLAAALDSEAVDEPHAMTIATVGPNGHPSARVVLLRALDQSGLVFFTNYDSRKGKELDANNYVAVVFYWGPLERQVRIEGSVERVSDEDSDAYFASRPHASQLAAVASEQSSVVESRATLEDAMEHLRQQYPEGTAVRRPQNWGGYRIVPDSFEFWQGRPGRLHDRVRYRRNGSEDSAPGWTIDRLAP